MAKSKTNHRGSGAAAKKKAKPTASAFSRTRADHQLERAEDYVELIQELIKERGEARTVDLAARLGVSHVTVSRTLKRLKTAGWIHTEPYRAIFLTEAGEELAEKTKRRHEIVLDFLTTAGVSAQAASLDAEGIEHHVSPETLEVLRDLTEKLRNSGA